MAWLFQKRYSDAEKYAQKAVEVFKSQARANRDPALALGLGSLADVQVEAKKYADAERNYKEAIAIYEYMEKPLAVDFAHPLRNYSALLSRMSRDSQYRCGRPS